MRVRVCELEVVKLGCLGGGWILGWCRGGGVYFGGDQAREGQNEGGVAFCGREERVEGCGWDGEVDALRVGGVAETPEGFYFLVGEGGDLF